MTKDEAVKIALRIIENDIDVKVNCSGAKDVIKDALVKQLPIEPKQDNKYYGVGICPSCGAVFINDTTNYCGNCGQKLDWKKGTTEDECIS